MMFFINRIEHFFAFLFLLLVFPAKMQVNYVPNLKKIFLLLFIIANFFTFGQCSPTWPITDIVYPYTTTTQTTLAGSRVTYLCGPSTIVYDTANFGCHHFYVNANCTLTFKPGACGAISVVYLKNNSTLNFVYGTGPVEVDYEPLAAINNTAGVSYFPISCPSLTFQTVNCLTGINEKVVSQSLNFYPNPNNGEFSITFPETNVKAEIFIYDISGKLIFSETKTSSNNILKFQSDLANGMYLVKVKLPDGSVDVRRLIINK